MFRNLSSHEARVEALIALDSLKRSLSYAYANTTQTLDDIEKLISSLKELVRNA